MTDPRPSGAAREGTRDRVRSAGRVRPLAVAGADDPGAGLLASPALAALWFLLVALTILEAVNELFRLGGPAPLYEVWVHDAVLVLASVLVLARVFVRAGDRRAWLAFGLGMLAWSIGTVAWSLAYSGDPAPPYPTFADVLWLLWYPATIAGIVLLIQGRVPQFELHRWMDGIAVTLLVLVAGFALVVQPVATDTTQGILATAVDFSYPVLDVLTIGAILGVYGLLAWRPDAMWLLIGLAVVTMAAADAAFAVQQARGVASDGHYEFVWTVGALAVALAAWVRAPDRPVGEEPVTGMRAIALALVAQALAIGIQIYAVFAEVGKSERIVTALVLVVASVQIILTRPRAARAPAPDPGDPRPVSLPGAEDRPRPRGP